MNVLKIHNKIASIVGDSNFKIVDVEPVEVRVIKITVYNSGKFYIFKYNLDTNEVDSVAIVTKDDVLRIVNWLFSLC